MKRSLSICLILLSFNAYGELNKWVDAQGNVHYSDEPPPLDVKAKKLTAPPAASNVPTQKTYIEREADLKKALKAKEEAEQKTAKQQEAIQAKQEYCASLRTNLTTLEKSPSVATYNDKGERVIMNDTARKQQIESTRKEISAKCI